MKYFQNHATGGDPEKTIIITRQWVADCPLNRNLISRGYRVLHLPMLAVVPRDLAGFDWQSMRNYDWLCFTSPNGVSAFFSQLPPGAELPAAAVGPGTVSALEALGVAVKFQPSEYTGGHLFEELAETLAPGSRILWPCGNLSNQQAVDALARRNITLTPLVVYDTLPQTRLSDLDLPEAIYQQAETARLVAFTSGSAIKAYVSLGLPVEGLIVACIGPSTAEAARNILGRVDVIARPHTLEALAEAIHQYLWKEEAG